MASLVCNNINIIIKLFTLLQNNAPAKQIKADIKCSEDFYNDSNKLSASLSQTETNVLKCEVFIFIGVAIALIGSRKRGLCCHFKRDRIQMKCKREHKTISFYRKVANVEE